jgi:hypothetical protein
MCKEQLEYDAAAGGKTTGSTSPILSVNDPRLDDDTPSMQRRRRVLAVIGKKFPASYQHVGEQAPFNQGIFKPMFAYDPQNHQDTCTSVNGHIMGKDAEKRWMGAGASGSWGYGGPKNLAWVWWKPGRLPSVGDTFNLLGVDDGQQHHSGIIVQVSLDPRTFWMTADGGQGFPEPKLPHQSEPGSTQSAYVVPRISTCRKDAKDQPMLLLHHWTELNVPNYIDSGGMKLSGWVDITSPTIWFEKNAAYDEKGSKEDYLSIKKRINDVNAAVTKIHFPQHKAEDEAQIKRDGVFNPVTL